MKTTFLKLSVIMAIAMTVITACDKHHSDGSGTPARQTPLVMTYQDFITPDDVQIMTSDTTKISVSSEYAAKLGVTDFSNRAVTIWRTIGTVPFVRIITSAKAENGKIVLNTVRGEFCDMFENLDVTLETDLFVNRNYVPAVARRSGTTLDVNDISSKYTDEDGVLHPAVIIFEDSPALRSIQTKTGESKNYFTAEELLEDNFDFDVIDVHSDFALDYAWPKTDEDAGVSDTDAKIHIKGKFGLLAKLSAYANIKISWFKLKKFETGVRGEAGISAKAGIGIQKSIKKEWEKELISLGEVYSVFWVGIIPVPYSVETSVKAAMEAKAQADISMYASYKYNLSFEKGCLYTSDAGWKNTSKEGKSSSKFRFDAIKGTAHLEAELGIFYEVAVKFAGSAGPTFAMGPKLSAEAEASAAVTQESIEVQGSAGAYIGFSGELGTKVSILGYQLAKWSVGFDLWKLKLFEAGFKYTYSPTGWESFETEWAHVLDQGSNEWTWNDNEPAKTSIPYRLPDPEMNF